MKDKNYKKIFENNKNWVDRINKKDKEFFNKITEGQNPDYLYIGCSDSRVPANEIMQLELGNLFVHRNIANQVPANDLNSHSVIQYAINALNVKHIIVCGHFHTPTQSNYKGTTILSTGSFVTQPVFWLVNLKTREVFKIDFTKI